ncbi:MAG: hypothetical protein R3240_06485, partial [Gammaproteobacteria bacterium]|nr:hypothetical protein [Gammaproteobacteria bacterium]
MRFIYLIFLVPLLNACALFESTPTVTYKPVETNEVKQKLLGSEFPINLSGTEFSNLELKQRKIEKLDISFSNINDAR